MAYAQQLVTGCVSVSILGFLSAAAVAAHDVHGHSTGLPDKQHQARHIGHLCTSYATSAICCGAFLCCPQGSSCCAAAHPTARQLQAAQHSNPWLPAGLLVGGAQHRACTAAAGSASNSPTADDADAAQPNPGSHDTPDLAGSSSSSSTASSRTVNEHVTAAGARAPGQAAFSAGQASSSSSSRRPIGPPRRSGPAPRRLLPPGFRPGLPPPPAAAPLLRTVAPPSEADAAASNGSSSSRGSSNTSSVNGVGSSTTSGSTGSASGSSIRLPGSNGSSTSRYQQQQWQQQESLDRPIKLSDIHRIQRPGSSLAAIPGWFVLQHAWPGLLQQWEEAKQQLLPAMERLLSVSQSGDHKVVFFDLETTGCKSLITVNPVALCALHVSRPHAFLQFSQIGNPSTALCHCMQHTHAHSPRCCLLQCYSLTTSQRYWSWQQPQQTARPSPQKAAAASCVRWAALSRERPRQTAYATATSKSSHAHPWCCCSGSSGSRSSASLRLAAAAGSCWLVTTSPRE